MPKNGDKSITFNKKIIEKMNLSSEKVRFLLNQNLDEKESLRKFAANITKTPETVRVYSPGLQKEVK